MTNCNFYSLLKILLKLIAIDFNYYFLYTLSGVFTEIIIITSKGASEGGWGWVANGLVAGLVARVCL